MPFFWGEHLSSPHNSTREVFRMLAILPAVCSVFAGFVVIGRQCRGWLELGHWPTIVPHDLLNWLAGRPISVYQLEEHLLNLIESPVLFSKVEARFATLDAVLRWVLDRVPLSEWLIVIIPAIWFLTSGLVFKLFIRARTERPSTSY
jgi:hypothetical protein